MEGKIPVVIRQDSARSSNHYLDEGDVTINSRMLNLKYSMLGIPGIDVTSMIHYARGPILFFFYSRDPQGLFFLARCCDRRYFKHGDKWKIDVSVADAFDGNHLPVYYTLRREISKEETLEGVSFEIEDLIENINYHFNHENFITGYALDKEKFSYRFDGEFISVK